MLAHENYSLPHKAASFLWISFVSLLHGAYSTKKCTASQLAVLGHLRKGGHHFVVVPDDESQEASARVLPADGYEGTVEATALCSTVVADQLADPVGLLLPVHVRAAAPARALVLASQEERNAIGVFLCQQGIRKPVEDDEIAMVGKKVLNGACSVSRKDQLIPFDVSFQSRELASEAFPVPRLIMLLIPYTVSSCCAARPMGQSWLSLGSR